MTPRIRHFNEGFALPVHHGFISDKATWLLSPFVTIWGSLAFEWVMVIMKCFIFENWALSLSDMPLFTWSWNCIFASLDFLIDTWALPSLFQHHSSQVDSSRLTESGAGRMINSVASLLSIHKSHLVLFFDSAHLNEWNQIMLTQYKTYNTRA